MADVITTNIPNTFQHPNWNVDQIMYLLTPQENVVLTFITRHILGWQRERLTRRKHISTSMFVNGYSDEDGQAYHGTGLGSDAVRKALEGLVTYGVIIKHDYDNDGQEWELPAKPKINWQGLEERKEGRKEAAKTRTNKARNLRRLSVGQTTRGSVGQTTSGLSDRQNQTHQTHQTNIVTAGAGDGREGAERIQEAQEPVTVKSVPETPVTTPSRKKAAPKYSKEENNRRADVAIAYGKHLGITGQVDILRRNTDAVCVDFPDLTGDEMSAFLKWFKATYPKLSLRKPGTMTDYLLMYRALHNQPTAGESPASRSQYKDGDCPTCHNIRFVRTASGSMTDCPTCKIAAVRHE